MSFLNPLLLFGLAAISVPIIIHLLNRRKFQRVVWAAMRFLKTSVEQNQRRIKLEDILLLILRCLLVAILALALARPALKSEANSLLAAKATAVIIVDNSYSMNLSDGVETLFNKARKVAEEILGSLPPGSSTALFLASDIVKPVIPEPTHDFNLVRKVLREAKIFDHTTDMLPAIKQAVELLRSKASLRKEIYLVTDGQALGWSNMQEIHKILESAKKDQILVQIIILSSSEENNLGIARFSLASGLTPINYPVRFEAQVNNFGINDVNNIKVSLSIDGNPPVDEAIIESLPAGESKTVSLFAKFYKESFYSITAKISEDRLLSDDFRTLAIRAVKEVKALIVDGDPGREPRESHSFFLRHALQPVPPAEAPQYFIKPTIITTRELSTVRFDDFDAVILANVSELPPQALPSLQLFLKRGGGLMIFSGPLTFPDYYNTVLWNQSRILPASLGKMIRQNIDENYFLTLQDKNYDHPLVEIWNDPSAGTLGSARFFNAYELILPQTTNNITNTIKTIDGYEVSISHPRVVVNFKDGKPAIVDHFYGNGRVIMFASTANTLWNDLPVRPAYVPLIHRMLGGIVMRQAEALNIRVGEPFFYRMDNEYLGKDVIILSPKETTNSLRGLRRIELINGMPALHYDETDFSGAYDVSIVGETQKPIKFAAQPDYVESNLRRLSPNQIETLRSSANVIVWKPGVSLKTNIEKDRFGIELWLPLLALGLLIALTESFLAQLFSKTK